MAVLAWIILSGLLMSAISAVGIITLLLKETTLKRITLPLVAFSAGSLLGGAFLHMIPESVEGSHSKNAVYLWILVGFSTFFVLEQFMHWHHCHREYSDCVKKPVGYFILFGDGIHNFTDGLAVATAFMVDIRLGITTWIAVAAHEIPQELSDFVVLIHSGWSKSRALLMNWVSALTFLLGSLLAYTASFKFDISFLLPFAAGNFIYIAASDMVPEVNKHRSLVTSFIHFGSLMIGILLLLFLKLTMDH
jgi:zinc and cadmium transporter